MKRTAPKLKRLYNLYNKKWFGGALPKNAIVAWNKSIKYEGLHGQAEDEYVSFTREGFTWVARRERPIIIELSTDLKKEGRTLKWVLLHEMAHVALMAGDGDGGVNHGDDFQAEMLRLAKAGAFRKIW